MDRAEAIEILAQTDVFDEEAQEAFDMAIAALREQDATDINVGCKTNADRIRAMTDEELAEWIEAVSPYEEYCGCCPAKGFCNTNYKGMECKDIVRLWLQQPVKEGADHE